MSQTTIAMNDHTTAFVVAIPTPLAPPDAKYPQVQLIREIVPPNTADLSKQIGRASCRERV